MIRAALSIVIFASCVVNLTALDTERLADCIRAKENFHGRDGGRGERGPYQIRASVWSMHMPGIPFAMARQEAPARACALKHIAWLVAQLQARHVDVTAFNVALCWNAGLTGGTTGRAPIAAYHYALDVERLYNLRGARLATPRIYGIGATVRTCDDRECVRDLTSVFAEHRPTCGSASI